MGVGVRDIGGRLGVFRQAAEFSGISLWIAWVLLIYSGEFNAVAGDYQLNTTLSYLASTVCISLTFFAAGIAYPRAERLVFDNRVVVCGGLAASLGTVGIVFVSATAGVAGLALSSIVTGTGTGIVALRACLAMGELSARNAFIVSSATLLLAFVIYLAALSLPHLLASILLAVLPLLAGLHVCLHRDGEEAATYEAGGTEVSHPLWRMASALFILAVVFSLSRGMYPSGIDISEFNDSRNYAAVGSMAFCIAMLTFALLLPQGTSFGQVGYWMVVAIVFLTTFFPVLGLDSAVSNIASTVVNSALGVTAWALFGAMSSLSRVSPVRVYGLGFSAFMLGSAVGWPLGFAVSAAVPGAGGGYVGVALLLVVFLVVLTLFRQTDLVRVIHAADDADDADDVGGTGAAAEAGAGEPGTGMVPDESAASGVDVDAQARARGVAGTVDASAHEAVASGDAGAAVPQDATLPDALPPAVPVPTDPSRNATDERPRAAQTSWKKRMTALAQEYYLTERETEVFLLLAKGLNARTVSDSLGFSYNTARVHVRNIYVKFDVHSRGELVEFAAFHDHRLKGM